MSTEVEDVPKVDIAHFSSFVGTSHGNLPYKGVACAGNQTQDSRVKARRTKQDGPGCDSYGNVVFLCYHENAANKPLLNCWRLRYVEGPHRLFNDAVSIQTIDTE
jgi:hypothetical protein